jgi:hypothetical protein
MRWTTLALATIGLAGVTAAAVAQTVDPSFAVLREGSNYDIEAAPNGDLHMIFRSGPQGGNNTQFRDLYYSKLTAQGGNWSPAALVFEGDVFNVSTDIDTNQPVIGFNPVPGVNDIQAWFSFSGNVRRKNFVDAFAVNSQGDQIGSARMLGTGPWFGGPFSAPVAEIRGVELAIAEDGHVWGCWIWIDTLTDNVALNGVYCSNNGELGGEERASAPPAGEGLALALGPGGMPHVVQTFGAGQNNASWSPRASLNPAKSFGGGIAGPGWEPGNLSFNIPFSAGKVACVDTNDNDKLDCVAVTAVPPSFVFRVTFAFSLDRSSGQVQVVKGAALQQWAVDATQTGLFNSEDIRYARSAEGREAIATAMDGDLQAGLDLAVVMIKPPGVDWPQGPSVDANGDGIHDAMGGTGATLREVYLGTPSPPPFHVFRGTEGRAVLTFPIGETPAVAFSGEDLWVVYHDDVVKNTKAYKISFVPPVPEMSEIGMLVLLAGLSVLLVASGRSRRRHTAP